MPRSTLRQDFGRATVDVAGRARSDAVARKLVRAHHSDLCSMAIASEEATELLNSRSQHKTRLQRLT